MALLERAGFSDISIEERGTDIAVIANKLLVLMVRLLRPQRWRDALWTSATAMILAPVTMVFLGAAHIALLLNAGSRDDPLGYGVIAVKI